MDCVKFVEVQKEFYQQQLDQLYPDYKVFIKARNQLEHLLVQKSKVIYHFCHHSIHNDKLPFKQEDGLIKREKENAQSYLCAVAGISEGSHIIPQHSYIYLEKMGIDAVYLNYRTGHNIVKTSANLHKFMELKNKTKDNPPLLTMIPLEWISLYYNDSDNGSGVDGFISMGKKMGFLTDSNYINDSGILILIHPNWKDPQSIDIIRNEIEHGFKMGLIHNLNHGNLFWLVHCAWTLALWGFHLNK